VTDCDEVRLSLGSYALGGLEPDEAARVRRHLHGCETCRAAHAELGALPALLDLVDPGTPPAAAPPARLEDAVLAGIAAERTAQHSSRGRRTSPAARRPRMARWRVALPSGLAGAAAGAAALAAAGLLSVPGGDGRDVTLSAPGSAGDARADARLTSTSAGTTVDLQAELPPLRRGEVYELWFVRGGGRVSAGTFTVDAAGRADLRLSTAARGPGYDRLGITREPDAVDPARNGPTVVAGALSG